MFGGGGLVMWAVPLWPTVALGCQEAPPTFICYHFLFVPPSFCCFGVRLFQLTFLKKYCECCPQNKGQRSEQRSRLVFPDLPSLVFALLLLLFNFSFFFF